MKWFGMDEDGWPAIVISILLIGPLGAKVFFGHRLRKFAITVAVME